MELSLLILLEKLKLPHNRMELVAPDKTLFSDILLLTSQTTVLKAGVLYLGDTDPGESLIFEPGCGLVLMQKPRPFPCDVLFIWDAIPFHDLFNQVSQIFSYFRKMKETLSQLIYHQQGLQQVVEVIAKIFDCPAYLVDSSFKVLGITAGRELSEMMASQNESWRALVTEGYLPHEMAANLIKTNELQTLDVSKSTELVYSQFFDVPFITCNLRHKSKLQGHLFIIGIARDLTPGDVELADQFGSLVLQALLTDPNFQTTRGRDYEHFIIDMLEGNPMKQEHMVSQAKSLNYGVNGRFVLARIIHPFQHEFLTEHLARQLEGLNGSKPVPYKDSIVVIFPLEKTEPNVNNHHLMDQLSGLCQRQDCLIGVSEPMDGFSNLPLQFVQASAAIDLGKKTGAPKPLFQYRDLVFAHPFLKIEAAKDLLAMCHPGILKLQKYDQANGTPFLATLEIYLENERHAVLTAKKLHLHRHTLTYRLEKINEIHPFFLDDAPERKRIGLSLEILKWMEKTADPAAKART